jgi:hypothetical protein
MSEETQQPTAAEIAAEIAKINPPQEAPQPRMTEDELKEYLQVYEPTEDYVNAFQTAIISEESTPEDRQRALIGLRDGFMNQATRAAELMMEEKLQEMEQKLAPANNYAQQAQAEQLWNDFATKYPALKEHEQMVDMVSTSLVASGYKPASQDELFGKVAEGVTGLLQKTNPNFVAQPKQAATEMPSMSSQGSTPGGGVVTRAATTDETMDALS